MASKSYLGNQTYIVLDGRLRYVYEAMLVETKYVQIVHNNINYGDFNSHNTFKVLYYKSITSLGMGIRPYKTQNFKIIQSQRFSFQLLRLHPSVEFYFLLSKFTPNPHLIFLFKSKYFENFRVPIMVYALVEKNWTRNVHFTKINHFETFPSWYEFQPRVKGRTAKKKKILKKFIFVLNLELLGTENGIYNSVLTI